MTKTPRRIEIGLDGGQVVAARVSDDALESLRKALDKGGWHRLETEDSHIDLYIAKVVFVKTAGDDQKVGF